MPLFNRFHWWYNHSAPVVSLTVRRKDARSQDRAADWFVTSHFSTINESEYQACVAELLERDLEREFGVEDWVSVTVCSGCAFCRHFMSRDDFCDFNEVLYNKMEINSFSTVCKKTTAVHFTIVPCEPNTANRNIKKHIFCINLSLC